MLKGPFMFGCCTAISICFGCLIVCSTSPWERLISLVPLSIGITGAYTSIILCLMNEKERKKIWE